MKFGKTLRATTQKEWRFYAVDYKELKQTLKRDDTTRQNDFFQQLEESERKLQKFYEDKEMWAFSYMKTLEERVSDLRQLASAKTTPTASPSDSISGGLSVASDDEVDVQAIDTLPESPGTVVDLAGFDNLSKQQSFTTKQSHLKEEYRRMGSSKEFKTFIYAKKSLATFSRELKLLLEFFEINKVAFSKILKKFDKATSSTVSAVKFAETMKRLAFLDGSVKLTELKESVDELIDEVNACKPQLPEGWENRKVYTIGCFDLFHRGHQNVLLSLREFGYYIVAGIHDDASYFKLKNKYTIDNLETRMANVKPFVDQLYVIPSTDPLPYIRAMVSEQDIASGECCYARGDDMLEFPARPWVESVMPVHFVPRTESCSSTLLRTIYHAPNEELRKKAAFAKTRYDGKPIDENGNVLKLNVVS